MQEWADKQRRSGKRIGFVPTMGYLHRGHLSLLEEARIHSDVLVASIFVNPMQFAANEDLSRYPRDPEGDARKLKEAGTNILFLPAAEEVYPRGYQTNVTVEKLTQGLCGRSRPTHFRGVTTVVAKLFHMVKPHVAVFGEKDYQQLAAVRRMVEDLNFDVQIIGGSIVREDDGLAMSSRNAYLSPAERQAALCLNRSLTTAQQLVNEGELDAAAVLQATRAVLEAEPLARIDYVELVDSETLEPVRRIDSPAVVALAVFFGRTRLIDNCLLNPPASRRTATTV